MGSAMKRLKGDKQADQRVVQQQVPVQYGPGAPQMPMQPPLMVNQMPYGYGSGYPNVPGRMSGYPVQMSVPSYGNDALLSNMTGFSPIDIANLRMEFYNYANPTGIIDRDGFRRLYIASLVNKTWDMLDREAEMAFRNFDTNRTGGLDFNEYMFACARMLRGNVSAQNYPY